MRHHAHPQTPATRAKISRALKGKKRLTSRQKADNISRHAREKHKAGQISSAELKRRLGVSGKVRNPVPKKGTSSGSVQLNDMHAAIANMLAGSQSKNADSHKKLATKMRKR